MPAVAAKNGVRSECAFAKVHKCTLEYPRFLVGAGNALSDTLSTFCYCATARYLRVCLNTMGSGGEIRDAE